MYGYSLKASETFIECADRQLTEQFIRQTGINPGKNVNLSISTHRVDIPVYGLYSTPDGYIKKKLMINLYVNHNWNPVTIYWKSKSGRDYSLHHEVEDGNDIEFWFERLDPALYLKQLYPGQQLPFRLKDLTYELVTERINIDCTIVLQVKKEMISRQDAIIQEVNDFIGQYNLTSEARKKGYGVIHKARASLRGDDTIVYDIDLGSTGPHFLKQLLMFFSKLNYFAVVKLE